MGARRGKQQPQLGEILRSILELWHWQGELIQSALREARAGGWMPPGSGRGKGSKQKPKGS